MKTPRFPPTQKTHKTAYNALFYTPIDTLLLLLLPEVERSLNTTSILVLNQEARKTPESKRQQTWCNHPGVLSEQQA